jgi:hypothetical protein
METTFKLRVSMEELRKWREEAGYEPLASWMRRQLNAVTVDVKQDVKQDVEEGVVKQIAEEPAEAKPIEEVIEEVAREEVPVRPRLQAVKKVAKGRPVAEAGRCPHNFLMLGDGTTLCDRCRGKG